MLESEGQRKLEENVLATLPSKDVTRTIDKVISDVVQIQSSALYNFVQPSVRGVIDGARELLQTLERGEQVQVAQIPAKGFMRNVLEACAFFAKFEVPAGVDDAATTLYGKSALKEILKSLRLQTRRWDIDDGEVAGPYDVGTPPDRRGPHARRASH